MIKRLLLTLLVFATFIPAASAIVAREADVNFPESEPIPIYFFYGDGCPHCADEEVLLDKIQEDYPRRVEVLSFEVWYNDDNKEYLSEVADELGITVTSVPFTVIGQYYFIGYQDDESTGANIENAVQQCLDFGCADIGSKIYIGSLSVPFLGDVNPENFSLPTLTVIMGLLDGFNPCAMWTLLFLITLLLGMENRRRMWVLGIAFIVASAAVYFLFMAAWLNLLIFLGFILWIRIAIGLVALAGGGYNIKEFFTNKSGTCKVTKSEKRKKVFDRLREITHEKNFFLALAGIILLAIAVNLVELLCSAGLPAVYTQILILNDLAVWQHYLYLLLYILFFMLDDLFVFALAMITLRATGLTTKYTRASHLIGGILMLIIGILLIAAPEWLMFG